MTDRYEEFVFREGFRRGYEKGKADRPKGEWIDTGKDPKHEFPLSARWYRCSVCGLETNTKTNYCFDCGADMRGDNNEAD